MEAVILQHCHSPFESIYVFKTSSIFPWSWRHIGSNKPSHTKCSNRDIRVADYVNSSCYILHYCTFFTIVSVMKSVLLSLAIEWDWLGAGGGGSSTLISRTLDAVPVLSPMQVLSCHSCTCNQCFFSCMSPPSNRFYGVGKNKTQNLIVHF